MTRGLTPVIAALALVMAVPGYAQDAVEEGATSDDAAAPVEAVPESEQTYILAAPARFLAAYGGQEWLDPESEICLEDGETVVLARPASRIVSMELRGPLCTTVAAAPDEASILVERESQTRTVRAGATRGVSTTSRLQASDPQTPGFRVASGTEGVLARFPVGTRVALETEICLARREQVTLISSRGQRVTYRGPGCARRNTRPSSDNLGGFTFGWNGYAAPRAIVALP